MRNMPWSILFLLKISYKLNFFQGQQAENETRCVLTEAARIARGQIQPLSELCSTDIDAAVFPGGFGVAKNL